MSSLFPSQKSGLGISGVALVTGAGSGIGRCTSLLLAHEGCSGIALVDTNPQSLEKVREEVAREATPSDFTAVTIVADVSDESSVKNMIAEVVKSIERLDYAANCAGIGFNKAIGETNQVDWDRIIALNLSDVFLCVREEIQQMLAQQPLENEYIFR